MVVSRGLNLHLFNISGQIFKESPAETGSFPISKWLFVMLNSLLNQDWDLDEFP